MTLRDSQIIGWGVFLFFLAFYVAALFIPDFRPTIMLTVIVIVDVIVSFLISLLALVALIQARKSLSFNQELWTKYKDEPGAKAHFKRQALRGFNRDILQSLASTVVANGILFHIGKVGPAIFICILTLTLVGVRLTLETNKEVADFWKSV